MPLDTKSWGLSILFVDASRAKSWWAPRVPRARPSNQNDELLATSSPGFWTFQRHNIWWRESWSELWIIAMPRTEFPTGTKTEKSYRASPFDRPGDRRVTTPDLWASHHSATEKWRAVRVSSSLERHLYARCSASNDLILEDTANPTPNHRHRNNTRPVDWVAAEL